MATNKNGKTMNKVTPQTKHELRNIIIEELKRQGEDADLNFIDTSKIRDMSELFEGVEIGDICVRNIKIDKWDVSHVTNMYAMFSGLLYFKADLSKWDVSNVTNMRRMFDGARLFNGDLSRWDVSGVEDMSYMFCEAESFNQPLSICEVCLRVRNHSISPSLHGTYRK